LSATLLVTWQNIIGVPVLIGSDVNYLTLCLRLIETLDLHFDRFILIRHSFDLDLHLTRGFSESKLRRLFLVVNFNGACFVHH
jgi:hypothetical protein